ncbi:hypothetical protein D088_580035 [Salmonella enterica subsp. houtenae serovar 16:z4,z32:-- str. RKS3027]|nr:hypothetical protein D088_580035 [Salmonella enterica subsp. houtenae serovar 16:z4,z32:-- str. RKS3027]
MLAFSTQADADITAQHRISYPCNSVMIFLKKNNTSYILPSRFSDGSGVRGF